MDQPLLFAQPATFFGASDDGDDQHDAFGIHLTIRGQAASVSLGAEESITIDDDGPTESHNRIPQKKFDLPNPQH